MCLGRCNKNVVSAIEKTLRDIKVCPGFSSVLFFFVGFFYRPFLLFSFLNHEKSARSTRKAIVTGKMPCACGVSEEPERQEEEGLEDVVNANKEMDGLRANMRQNNRAQS